jgi:hypothetical protein
VILIWLAAAIQATPIDAERAFAAMAQTQGQWTAFRAYAAPHAVMFTPGTVPAQTWLPEQMDPPIPVMWWPGRSWISCDGSLAVNTGSWVRAGGKSVGYFTTMWARQPDGSWKWLLDHGDVLARPRPTGDEVVARRGKCPAGKPIAPHFTVQVGLGEGGGISADQSLRWRWQLAPDLSRRVTAELWTASGYKTIVDDKVAAP